MRRHAVAAPARYALLAGILSSAVAAGEVRELRPDPLRAISPGPPKVLGTGGGLTLRALAPDEARRAAHLAGRLGGDGGGASVSGLQLFQSHYLDSACAFPQGCTGPCNVVLMYWTETTRNPDGVRIRVDGTDLGLVPGLPVVPGIGGAAILGVAPGVHAFRAEDIAGGAADEVSMTVLAAQPFDDPAVVRCSARGPVEGGACRLEVSWEHGAEIPDVWDVYIDGLHADVASGQETKLLRDVFPGAHTASVVGTKLESPRAFYSGCAVGTACDVSCQDGACDPPVFVRLCQSAYDAGGENAVRVEWIDGEAPYGAGVETWVDGEPFGRVEPASDAATTLVSIGGLAPGPRRIGLQGICVEPTLVSAVVEETITALSASPYSSPLVGDPECIHDPETATTTLAWETSANPLFVDVYLRAAEGLYYLGTIPGESSLVTVNGTDPDDFLVLQFFATLQGGCYGSDMVALCGPREDQRYIPGLCNGTGSADGTPQISAAIYGLSFLFTGGPSPPCEKACDSNGDGNVDISDMVHILSYLFLGGPAPSGWEDSSQDGAPDPTCLAALPGDDCAIGHAVCVP